MAMQCANAVNESDRPANEHQWLDVPAWTPEQRFLFDLEGELYKMVALAETVETLLVQVAVTLQRVNPPKAAALDYAATNLSDLIGELSERYHEVRFPSPDDAPIAA